MNDADVIYLEADAEITEAIDQLKNAKTDAVKLVIPARSGLLQSAVNLKLLKKAAKDHDKALALVTKDKTATFLAAGVGLAVAANLKVHPEIPEAVEREIEPDIVEPDDADVLAESVVASGNAKQTKAAKDSSKKPTPDSSNSDKGDDNELGDNLQDEPVVTTRSLTDDAEDAPAPDKKPKVPNYSKFQKKVWIAAGIAVGVILAIVAAIVLPTAKVTVLTKASKLPIDSKFILDSSATQNDPSSLTFASKKVELSKDLNQAFTATGKKDVGTKAGGTVALKNCEDTNPRAVPAGSQLTAGGKTFVSTNAVNLSAGTFNIFTGFKCSDPVNVAITSTANGESYNLGTTTFTVAGTTKIQGSGSTTGGTSKTITVVTQDDIDKAKQQALDADKDASKQALLDKVGKDSQSFDDTFAASVASVNSSVPVDSENANGTVIVKVTYTVLTATNSDLTVLLDTQAKSQLPTGNQQLYQSGLSDAKFTVVKPIDATKTQMQVATTAYYGEKIDTAAIARAVAGKPKKDVTSIVQKSNPAVTNTLIESNPALFPSLPALQSHVKVEIKVSTQ